MGAAKNQMASRWRTWDGEAHVDSHGLPPKHSPRFEPVRHSFDWDDVPELLKAFVVPEDLSRRIGESNGKTIKCPCLARH